MTDIRLKLTGLAQLSSARLEDQSPDATANLAEDVLIDMLRFESGKPAAGLVFATRRLSLML